MGLFAGIEDAKETAGGNYIRVGTKLGDSAIFDLEVKAITVGKTRKGVEFLAVDLIVRGSNTPNHQIGEVVNWFNGADKEPFLGNVKNFAAAVLSAAGPVDPGTITEAVMLEIANKGGEGVRGTRVKCQVTIVQTKAGNMYSRHLWFPAGAKIEPEKQAS